jgi:hypothetical protein
MFSWPVPGAEISGTKFGQKNVALTVVAMDQP